jgi:hypothetical protein
VRPAALRDVDAVAPLGPRHTPIVAPPIQDLIPEVDPERDHIRGAATAPITVIDLVDFQCPHVDSLMDAIKEAKARAALAQPRPIGRLGSNSPAGLDAGSRLGVSVDDRLRPSRREQRDWSAIGPVTRACAGAALHFCRRRRAVVRVHPRLAGRDQRVRVGVRRNGKLPVVTNAPLMARHRSARGAAVRTQGALLLLSAPSGAFLQSHESE